MYRHVNICKSVVFFVDTQGLKHVSLQSHKSAQCNNLFRHHGGSCSKLSFEQIGLAPILSFALSLCVNFDNCLFETTQLGINLLIHSFTIAEQKFENYLCITCKTLRLSSLSICSFDRVGENFKNCVCETTQIGTNLPIYFFIIADENFENCLFEKPHIGTNSTLH